MSTIDLILLGLLKEGPASAYDLTLEAEKRELQRLLKISKPAIYKSCKRMRENGLVSEKVIKSALSHRKIIYMITRTGRKRFHELMSHFSTHIETLHIEFNSFIWNIEKLQPGDALNMLNELSHKIKSLVKWISQHEKETRSAPFATRAIVKQYRMLIETLERWNKATIRDFQKENSFSLKLRHAAIISSNKDP